MSQTYVSLNDFKGEGLTNIEGGQFDPRMLPFLEGVSRQIEDYVGRWFYPRLETRYFHGSGTWRMILPEWDIIEVTTLKEDEDEDATYETTWATTDYELVPYEHDPNSKVQPRPFWQLEVNQRSNGTKTVFLRSQKRFELVGKFGYCELTEDTGAQINEGAEWTASDAILKVDKEGLVHIGDTLIIESEYVYVTAQEETSSTDFTVSRGMHGSTAAAHADGTAISKLVYPKALVEACIMQAGREWNQVPGGYPDEVNTAIGRGLLQDVRQKLDPFKRHGIS